MRMIVGIVTATPELLLQAARLAAETASVPMNLGVHGNAFDPDVDALRAIPNVGDVRVTSSPTNIGMTRGLHHLWEVSRADYDIIAYQHDDLDIYEAGWDQRVIEKFEQFPNCAVVSFGGADALASDDLYKTPYQMGQLARSGFLSNLRSAERHGERTYIEQPIASFDSFSMICRMSFLDRIGGWAWYPYPCHNIDNSLACMARRHGMTSWLVPIDCEHHGGKTSTAAIYQDYAMAEFGGDRQVHADSHVWMYEEFRDVLPLRV